MIDYTVDYTEQLQKSGAIGSRNLVCAHGRDHDVLILRRLSKPIKRFDGKTASYEIELRWLSQPCLSPEDEAWCCVRGEEITYWQKKEIPKEVFKEGVSLFEAFNIHG